MWPEQRAQCAVRSPACHVRGIFLLLLLVMVQMIISLVPFDGVFIRSDKVLISPYRFCQIQQTGEWSCDNVYKSHLYERSQSQGAEAETLSKPHSNSVRVAVYLAVYVPVIIVAFQSSLTKTNLLSFAARLSRSEQPCSPWLAFLVFCLSISHM